MKSTKPARHIVTLADLIPAQDVRGGHGRRVFGAESVDVPNSKTISKKRASTTIEPQQEDSMAKKTKDLSPKKSPVGGKKTA